MEGKRVVLLTILAAKTVPVSCARVPILVLDPGKLMKIKMFRIYVRIPEFQYGAIDAGISHLLRDTTQHE